MSVREPDLYLGTTNECFHSSGTKLVFIDTVKRLRRKEAISGPPSFKIAGEMPSGPWTWDREILEICLLMELRENVTEPKE